MYIYIFIYIYINNIGPGSIVGGNGAKTELHVLRKGQ